MLPSQTNLSATFPRALSHLLALALFYLPQHALGLTENYVPSFSGVAFYAVGITAILFSAAIISAYRAYAWLAYVIFSALILTVIASMEGALAYLLGGGDFVLWVLPFLVYTTTASFGYWVVAQNLDGKHSLTRFKIVFAILSGLCLVLVLSTFFWLRKIPLTTMWIPANVLFFAMLLSHTLPPLTWSSLGRQLTVFTRCFPFVISTFFFIIYGWHFLGDGFSLQVLNSINRFGLALFAVFALTIVLWRAFESRRQHDQAERRALKLAQNEARLQAELLRAERDYRHASAAVALHQSRLETVSHDLKQPIAALQVAVENLPDGSDSKQRLAQAVDYIHGLSKAYLHVDEPVGTVENNTASLDPNEQVSVSVFLSSLQQMFSAEAEVRNIELKFRSVEMDIPLQPLIAMRIMSNLVGNAIAHSQASRVLVVFRRRERTVRFEVHDNGCGLDDEQQTKIGKPGQKGENSLGQGLGLSIVGDLCSTHGLCFDFRSKPGRGSSFYIDIPV